MENNSKEVYERRLQELKANRSEEESKKRIAEQLADLEKQKEAAFAEDYLAKLQAVFSAGGVFDFPVRVDFTVKSRLLDAFGNEYVHCYEDMDLQKKAAFFRILHLPYEYFRDRERTIARFIVTEKEEVYAMWVMFMGEREGYMGRIENYSKAVSFPRMRAITEWPRIIIEYLAELHYEESHDAGKDSLEASYYPYSSDKRVFNSFPLLRLANRLRL